METILKDLAEKPIDLTSEILGIKFLIPEVSQEDKTIMDRPDKKAELEKRCLLVDNPTWQGNGYRESRTTFRGQTRVDREVTNYHFCFLQTPGGRAHLSTRELQGYEFTGGKRAKLADSKDLPRRIYVDESSVKHGDKGLTVGRAYTEEEYQKLIKSADEAEENKQKLKERVADRRAGSEALKQIIENNSEIALLLEDSAENATHLGTKELTIHTQDGRDVQVEIYERYHHDGAHLSEDGTPLIDRKFIVSCKEVFPEKTGRHDTVAINMRVKGWKGFTISSEKPDYDSQTHTVRFGLHYMASGGSLRLSSSASISKPYISHDRLDKIQQQISANTPIGTTIELTRSVEPDADKHVGEFDVSREIGEVEAYKLHRQFEESKIAEIGDIPERLEIRDMSPDTCVTQVHWTGYETDDRESSIGRVTHHTGRFVNGVIQRDIPNLPSTNSDPHSNANWWEKEFFNLKSFTSLDPDLIKAALESGYLPENLIKFTDTDRPQLSQTLTSYLKLSPEGKQTYAEKYSEESQYLERVVNLCRRIPEDIAGYIRERVTTVENVIAVTDVSVVVDPGKIIGYTIVFGSEKDGWHSDSSGVGRNVMVLEGEKTEGIEVNSKFVPVVEAKDQPGGILLEKATILSTVNVSEKSEQIHVPSDEVHKLLQFTSTGQLTELWNSSEWAEIGVLREELVRLKAEARSRVVKDPTETQTVIAQIESLELEIEKNQSEYVGKVCAELGEWSKQINHEYFASDKLPEEDTSYRSEFLYDAGYHLRSALHTVDPNFKVDGEGVSTTMIVDVKDVEQLKLTPGQFVEFRNLYGTLRATLDSSSETSEIEVPKMPFSDGQTFTGTLRHNIDMGSWNTDYLVLEVTADGNKITKEKGQFAPRKIVSDHLPVKHTYENLLVEFEGQEPPADGEYQVTGVVIKYHGRRRGTYYKIQSLQ